VGLAEDLDPVAEAGEGFCETAVPANTGSLSVRKLSSFFFISL